jgi:hypothetical protein
MHKVLGLSPSLAKKKKKEKKTKQNQIRLENKMLKTNLLVFVATYMYESQFPLHAFIFFVIDFNISVCLKNFLLGYNSCTGDTL